jgi:hypothetical protein
MAQRAFADEADSIKAHLLCGLTSAENAIRATDPNKVSQYTYNARSAHDTARRKLFRAELSGEWYQVLYNLF